MAVTPKGIYYPTGDDAANWATIFQTMANSIDTALGDFTYDSGWIPITNFQNGWKSYYTAENTQAAYRKVGKIVHCSSLIGYGTSMGTIFTLPSGFRSKISVYFCVLNNNVESIRAEAHSTGTIQFPRTGRTPSGYYSLTGANFVAG